MPIGMKIQPLDPEWAPPSGLAAAAKPAAPKSRLKRLFERQFPSVLRISAGDSSRERERESEKERERERERDPLPPLPAGNEVEPSSVVLTKMVQNFLEDGGDVAGASGRRNGPRGGGRCNCFNGNREDSSDDELNLFFSDPPSSAASSHNPMGAAEILKSLVLCSTLAEKSLLADVMRIVEKHRIKGKDEASRKLVVDGLVALGYDASTCKSTWEKTPSFPAGEYDYIDVVVGGGEGRQLVELDLQGEFEIARPAKAYRAVVQALPAVFVGGEERLQQVVALAAEAARQSMRRKGLHVPPWRRYDYMKSKWLSPTYHRGGAGEPEKLDQGLEEKKSGDPQAAASAWEPPAVEPKAPTPRGKMVTGLAAIF